MLRLIGLARRSEVETARRIMRQEVAAREDAERRLTNVRAERDRAKKDEERHWVRAEEVGRLRREAEDELYRLQEVMRRTRYHVGCALDATYEGDQ